MSAGFVLLVEVRLRIDDSDSLKGKRKVVRSVKDAVRERLGASVAEIEGHDSRQDSTLLCALVGRDERELARREEMLRGIVVARAGDAASFERTLRSLQDLA